MARIDREALRSRLAGRLEPGEDLLAWGWAACGFRNVFIGTSGHRLVIENVRLNLETASLEIIEHSRLEAVDAGTGDSSLPGWAKLNIQNALMDAVTTHLVIKPLGEAPRHYLFRPMPSVDGNRGAGLEIARVIADARPDLPAGVDLGSWRKSSGGRSSWLLWGAAGAVITGSALGFAAMHPAAAVAGAGAGFLLGAVIAICWNAIRVTAAGRG